MTESVGAQLLSFAEDHLWVHENLQHLLGQYRQQWVAVKQKRVIDSDADFDALLARLPDAPHTCIEFVTDEPLEIIV